MTRDEARQHLLAGHLLHDKAWTWSETTRSCWDETNCCYDHFGDSFYEDGRPIVERTLDDIESYVGFENLDVID
jgi:hypothetical protein